MIAKSFQEAIAGRRSIYSLNKNTPISDEKLIQTIETITSNVPSSFNTQSTRLVVLLKDEHDKFWDLVEHVLQPNLTSDEQRQKTGGRLGMFKAAYGTILFFEDPNPLKKAASSTPLYAHYFPAWSEHTSAMHQYALWVGLTDEGFGCNLQHYNPVVDNRAKADWGVDMEWSLKAQLVFGGKKEAGLPPAKEKLPVDQVIFVHGK